MLTAPVSNSSVWLIARALGGFLTCSDLRPPANHQKNARPLKPVRSRYDYEGVESEKAGKVMEHLRGVIASAKKADKFGDFSLETADDFEYKDPIDGSVASKQAPSYH